MTCWLANVVCYMVQVTQGIIILKMYWFLLKQSVKFPQSFPVDQIGVHNSNNKLLLKLYRCISRIFVYLMATIIILLQPNCTNIVQLLQLSQYKNLYFAFSLTCSWWLGFLLYKDFPQCFCFVLVHLSFFASIISVLYLDTFCTEVYQMFGVEVIFCLSQVH